MIKKMDNASCVINKDFAEVIENSVYNLEWIEASIKKIKETAVIMKYNINKWLMFENLLYNIMG